MMVSIFFTGIVTATMERMCGGQKLMLLVLLNRYHEPEVDELTGHVYYMFVYILVR